MLAPGGPVLVQTDGQYKQAAGFNSSDVAVGMAGQISGMPDFSLQQGLAPFRSYSRMGIG
jgi:hypothetical protein